MYIAIVVVYLGEQDEGVQMPEMVEPQKVRVMLPRDPVVAPKATNSAGVLPSQAPGERLF